MDFFCNIHLANVPISEKFTLKCNHSFCRDCILYHCTQKLKELQVKENQFICPDPNCRKPLDIFDIKQILSPKDFEKYDDYLAELAMSQENEISVNCPNPACGKKYFIWKDADYFTCNFCKITFCAKCKNEYDGHVNLTCAQYIEKLKTKEDKEFEKLIKKEKLMSCPVCTIIVERIRFCNVITCQSKVCQKKNSFCYLCGKLLAENKKEKHFLDNNTYSNECENTIKKKNEIEDEKKIDDKEEINEEKKNKYTIKNKIVKNEKKIEEEEEKLNEEKKNINTIKNKIVSLNNKKIKEVENINEEKKDNLYQEIKIEEKKINDECKKDYHIEFNEKKNVDNKNIFVNSEKIDDSEFPTKKEKKEEKIFEKIYEKNSNDKIDKKNIDFENKYNEDQHKKIIFEKIYEKNDNDNEEQKNIDFKNIIEDHKILLEYKPNHYEYCKASTVFVPDKENEINKNKKSNSDNYNNLKNNENIKNNKNDIVNKSKEKCNIFNKLKGMFCMGKREKK